MTLDAPTIIGQAVDTASALVLGGLNLLTDMYANPFGAIFSTLGLAGLIYGIARRFMHK